MPGNNLEFWGTQYGRDDLVHRVRYIQPTNGIRTKFEYQNIMYLTAGQIIPAVTGKSWDDFLRDRLLVPLRMTSTSTRNTLALRHVQFDFGTTRTQLRGKPLVTFELDQRARVAGLRIAGASLTRAPKVAAPGSP